MGARTATSDKGYSALDIEEVANLEVCVVGRHLIVNYRAGREWRRLRLVDGKVCTWSYVGNRWFER